MKIEDYFNTLNNQSQDIFRKTLVFRDELGKSHHLSSCIHEFGQCLNDEFEREMLKTVSSQLESANLNACLGLYRQAFSSLRLAFEMGLAVAYFSVHRLELSEWQKGDNDIRWSSLIDEDRGVLSNRFCKAFFEDFSKDVECYNNKAKKVYRSLSEFVHGNYETWKGTEIELEFDRNSLELYFENFYAVCEIVIFVLSSRYLKSFSDVTLESLQFMTEEMNHLSYVREYFGGPRG